MTAPSSSDLAQVNLCGAYAIPAANRAQVAVKAELLVEILKLAEILVSQVALRIFSAGTRPSGSTQSSYTAYLTFFCRIRSYASANRELVTPVCRNSSLTRTASPVYVSSGVYSRTDVNRGVHKAPANEIVNCTGLSISYTSSEQDILNPAGVNLIRALPGQGIRVWGARTASSNSSFKYVNVRRLFIFVEQSIKASTNWVVFEPNNSSLWARVQLTVSSFLENLFRAGMLAGETSSEAYFVNIGTSTMSQDDILNGRLICEIGIAPSRPAEFVIFRITQFTAESGGGE